MGKILEYFFWDIRRRCALCCGKNPNTNGASGGGAGEGFTGTMAFAPGTYPVIVGTGGGSVSVGNPSSINGINANGGVKGNTAGQGGSWTTGGVGGSGAQGVVVLKYLTSSVQ